MAGLNRQAGRDVGVGDAVSKQRRETAKSTPERREITLTPKATLGLILAMYEHKVFTMGALWNVNSFDQWGVELGKQLAARVAEDLAAPGEVTGHDRSTTELINRAKAKYPD